MKGQKEESEVFDLSEQKETKIFNLKPLSFRASYISLVLLWLLMINPSVAASFQSVLQEQHLLSMLKGIKWQECGEITNHTVECQSLTP